MEAFEGGEGPRKPHKLMAGNIVLGTYNFIELRLPEEWSVSRGEIPPEIVYTGEREGVGYVTEGTLYNYLVNLVGNETLSMQVRSSRKSSVSEAELRRMFRGGISGVLNVSGHIAYYYVGKRRVGLVRRREVSFARLAFHCSNTGRLIEIVVEGGAEESRLEEIIGYLSELRCHGLGGGRVGGRP